jgi:soluble lytic murein transglycosylase-like protein
MQEPPLGLRHPGEERRNADRRKRPRLGSWDRRFRERRRQQLRTFLIAAATLAAPSQVLKLKPLQAGVAVTMKDFVAVRADKAYEDLIQEAGSTYGVDPDLIRAVMRTESAFDPTVVSPVGAMGLMQLMPEVAQEFDVTDPFDPRQNIMAGTRLLRRLLNSHDGNIALTLASYNAGPGNVKKYRGVPPFRETRNYVKKIQTLLAEPSED